jgi:acyl-CoA synthetase (AMP-forming)/AMP-acid ligase II
MKVRTIPALLDDGAVRFGEHPAVVDRDVTLSYRGLAHHAREVSAALVAQGIAPGDRVAVWAPNRIEFILATLGAERIGAAVIPLNTRYRGHEARYILERSRATALILNDGFLDTRYTAMLDAAGPADDDRASGHLSGLDHLHTVIDLGDATAGFPSVLSWQAFLASAEDRWRKIADDHAAAVTADTVCDILFTSGTTGNPKGVMSAQFQTLGVAAAWARGAALSPDDRYGIVNPFFHGFGYKAGFMAAFTAGATVYPVATFEPVEVMALIERSGISVLPGVPTIFTSLINHPRRGEFDLSSLRFATAGAATVPENLFEQMRDVLGFETAAQAYGLTECMVATQSRPGEDPRHIAQTTGPAIPGIEIRIMTPEGTDAGVDTDGEIWLRGEYVMLGYFEDPAATAAAIDPEGWLHTGDIGRLDEHGCLQITDRIKDMFTVGGFNVYPAELEKALTAHPDVIDAAVIGIDDDRLGSIPRGYVVLRGGSGATPEEILEWCRERLANFKVPRQIVITDEFPRNAAGKILKTALREEARTL